jgi:hypothetical protein
MGCFTHVWLFQEVWPSTLECVNWRWANHCNDQARKTMTDDWPGEYGGGAISALMLDFAWNTFFTMPSSFSKE